MFDMDVVRILISIFHSFIRSKVLFGPFEVAALTIFLFFFYVD